jgi:hypothetical protein
VQEGSTELPRTFQIALQCCGNLQLPKKLLGNKAVKIRTTCAARLLLLSVYMMDLIFIAATGAFFAIALTYVWGCIRL